jgi:hypothetical protein
VLIVGSSSAKSREIAASMAFRSILFSSNHGIELFVGFNLIIIIMDY